MTLLHVFRATPASDTEATLVRKSLTLYILDELTLFWRTVAIMMSVRQASVKTAPSGHGVYNVS